MSRRFVLLDRDGTIIVEKHYLADPEGVELVEGAGAALRRLSRLGLGLVVLTNQSAIARGYLDRARLAEIHARMTALLEAEGVRLDGIFFCPHHPEEGCRCRKPAPGLVEQAVSRFGFDPGRAFMIGDMKSDVALGRAVGATSVLVRTGYGSRDEAEAGADHVADGLAAAAELIEALVAG